MGKAQKPPVTEYWPLVIGPLASGWPMVPLTEYTPPVLVPPPPSMVNQSMAMLWSRTIIAEARNTDATTKRRQVLDCEGPLALWFQP